MDKKCQHKISYPSTFPVPSSTLIPSSHPIVRHTLNRLTRPALLSLALDWLSDINQLTTAPYLLDSPDDTSNDLYPPASSLEELRSIYSGLEERGGTKRDVLDRIVEGDWRHGISLYALAMADMQLLYSRPSSQNWLAWELSPLSASSSTVQGTERVVPRFQPSIFLRNMQRECLPDIKAHFNIDRHATLPLLILRVWILESPYNTSFSLVHTTGNFLNRSRVFYIGFPDFSPYVFISSSNTLIRTSISPVSKAGETKSLRNLIMEAIPKAYSKPGERYRLRNTNLSAKSLEAMIEYRGNGRRNAASAVWATYAETHSKEAMRDNPLDTILTTCLSSNDDEFENGISLKNTENTTFRSRTAYLKRKKNDGEEDRTTSINSHVAKIRFGRSALSNDGKGIERFQVRIEDPFPNISSSDNTASLKRRRQQAIEIQEAEANDEFEQQTENETWRPEVSIVFTGSHIFAGIRELVEYNIIDGLRMPGWMTGEHAVSEGIVRNGRITNFMRYLGTSP